LEAYVQTEMKTKTKTCSLRFKLVECLEMRLAIQCYTPRWNSDPICRNRILAIDQIISLNTTELHGKALDWRDYGGPLAIFYFGRFVREQLLNDEIDPNRQKPPFPTVQCYQQGRLILRRIGEIPEGVTEIAAADPGESIDLGNGHRIEVPPQPKS
jgi:hypothetical protein